MKYDKPLGAILIGMVVVIPLEVIALFFKHIGWTTITNGEACSMAFIPEGSWTLGLMALPMVGAIAIVILYYLTKLIGTDYLPIKGAFIGTSAYAFIFTIWGALAKNYHLIQSPLGNYVIALNSAFGGFLAGILMKKYLFKESGDKIKIRRYSIVPFRVRKQEQKERKVRFVKPKKI